MKTEHAYIRNIRYGVQLFFLAISIYAGWSLYHFVMHFMEPGREFVDRAPSVEGFLPISGFMALKFFAFTGIVDPVHPAGFFIFLAAIATAVLLKKGFCGWICPVGTVSEYAWKAGQRMFGKSLVMPDYLDVSLRFIKYALFFIIVLLIGIAMIPSMMVLFFITDYYKTLDIKMLAFFMNPSLVSGSIVLALVGASFVYKNFWCRYLCPYGAFLGLLSLMSPVKIRRNDAQCTHCMSCTKHCPSQLPVEKIDTVFSPECFGCMTCVSHCPSKGALEVRYKILGSINVMKPALYPVLLVVLFYAVISIGVFTGKWKTLVPYDEFKRMVPAAMGVEVKEDKP